VGCEPASAASVAGVRQLVERGVIQRGERVVAVLTGNLLKDPEILVRYHRDQQPAPPRANPPIVIDATLAAVEQALGKF
jgi:threonine synthase